MEKLYENLILSQKEFQDQLNYWIEKINSEIEELNFPYQNKKSRNEDFDLSVDKVTLSSETSQIINKIGGNNQLITHILLSAVAKILICKYTGHNNIIVASPILSAMDQSEYNDLVLLKDDIKETDTFKDVLIKVKNTITESYKNQDYPLKMLLKKMGYEDDEAVNSIINVGMMMEGLHNKDILMNYKFNTAFCFKNEEQLVIQLFYNNNVISKSSVCALLDMYVRLVEQCTKDLDRTVKDMQLISEEEIKSIIYGFNDTKYEWDKTIDVVNAFSNIAQKYAEKSAVVAKCNKLTYKELDRKSNKLARFLREKQVQKGNVVGVMLEPGTNLIVSLLAVIKTGATYLPLEPTIPEKRFEYICKDSEINLIITETDIVDDRNINVDKILLDKKEEAINNMSAESFKIYRELQDIIYIIYTSGTTGMPKGVQVKDQGILNYINWFSKETGITAEDRTVLVSSFAFDLGYTVLYSSLFNGCELHMLNKEDYSNPITLLNYIKNNQITYMKTTPSLFGLISREEQFEKDYIFSSVRLVVLGGEMINLNDIERLNKIYPDTKVMNHYGPTETTIGVITYKVDFSDFKTYKNTPIIGKPIDNVQVYILDKDKKPLPINVPGEIYVSGLSLAKGYVNNEKLTEEKFIDNPFVKGQLMYKTNDKGGLTKDGSIEFLGRMDNQVKIRGYRVELEEIKNIIKDYKGVSDCLVIVKEDINRNKFICAYLVADEISITDIREYLRKSIPDYMIPSYFIIIDKILLIGNGKVNYKALPEPSDIIDTGVEYVAPRNEVEEKMCLVWQEVLGLKRVGIYDNFFALGGDSIKVIQVSTRLQNYGIKIELKNLMKYPTIDKLMDSVIVEKKKNNQEPVEGDVLLTPIQKQFLENAINKKQPFNQAVMLYKKEGFNIEALSNSLEGITQKHDALRMVYEENAGSIKQISKDINELRYELYSFVFENIEDPSLNIQEEVSKIQESMDLVSGPLLKVALFKTKEGDKLLITVHHLVADEYSLNIILQDLLKGYNQALHGDKVDLGDKTDSYKDWALKLANYAEDSVLSEEISYWTKVEDYEVPELVKDNNLELERLYEDLCKSKLEIESKAADKLHQVVCKKFNITVEEILITVLGNTLKKWTKNQRFKITIESNGRDVFDEVCDFSKSVGYFTYTYPAILDMSVSDDICGQIKHVKESIRKIPNKGIGYGVIKYLSDSLKEKIVFRRKPEIGFSYLRKVSEAVNNLESNTSIMSVDGARNVPYALYIKGVEKENKLVIEFSYNKKEYKTESIKNLINLYKENLQEVIDYCIVNEKVELTPSDLTYSRLSIEEVEHLQDKYEDKEQCLEIEDIYELIPMQELMLNKTTYGLGITPYFHYRTFTINNEINLDLLNKSFNLLLDKYDVLRTVYDSENSLGNLQIVYKHKASKIHYEDISSLNEEESEAYFREYIRRSAEKGYNLSKDTLTRTAIFKVGEQKYRGVWSNHHLVLDGWSKIILVREFLDNLQKLKSNKEVDMRKGIPFSEYVNWVKKQDMEQVYAYFQKLLEGYEIRKLVKEDEGAILDDVYIQDNVYKVIDEKMTNQLNDIAHAKRSTLSTVLRASWGIVLQKVNSLEDVVFGSIVSGRVASIPNMEGRVGSYINMIPVRFRNNKNISFVDCLELLHEQYIASEKYAYFGIDVYEKSVYKDKLMDSMVIVENYPVGSSMKEIYQGKSVVSDVEIFDQTHCNFNIFVTPFETTILKFSHNSRRYKKETVEKMANYLINILEQVIKNPDIVVKDIVLE